MPKILSEKAVTISELKKNSSGILAGATGMPVAVLTHNRIMAYLVPAELYEHITERLDDLELAEVAKVRSGEQPIPIRLADL